MFAKRAGRFMGALLGALNQGTFTPISAIQNETVSNEEVVHVDSTVRILESMQHIEVQTDANGNKALRLTQSGADLVQHFYQGGQ